MKNSIKNFDKKYNSEYYNEMYKIAPNYQVHYEKSIFFPLWKYTKERLDLLTNPKILEIGCGVGDCAHYLYDNGYTNYFGFDFSDYAIEIARKKSPQKFEVLSAYKVNDINFKYDVIIMNEVLEHLEDDIKVINMLNPCVFIASVPTKGGGGHARCFNSIEEVKERYYQITIANYQYIKANNKIKWIVFEAKIK